MTCQVIMAICHLLAVDKWVGRLVLAEVTHAIQGQVAAAVLEAFSIAICQSDGSAGP